MIKFRNSQLLNNEIQSWLSRLINESSNILEIWLIGSRANNRIKESSDWDFLLFPNLGVCSEISKFADFHIENVDLLVVTDGNSFRQAWGKEKTGTLASWQWKKINSTIAEYRSTKFIQANDIDDLPDEIKCTLCNVTEFTSRALLIWQN